MTEITLVGLHSEPLTKAFGEFKRWAASGDGDAVELIFIFLKDGGYLLSIGREGGRAVRDLQGLDRTYCPIVFGGIYTKMFDTRHIAIHKFREYKRERLTSPFLFGAAVTRRSAGRALQVEDVEALPDIDPLLKFEAEFLDEDSLHPGAPYHSVLKSWQQSRSRSKRERQPPPLPDIKQLPEDYFRQRARMLERHFPVTIERIRTRRYLQLMSVIQENGVKDWQAEQAACNLLLSCSICNGQPFYPTAASGELERRVAEAVRQREERSDVPELTSFSADQIIEQVRLDAVALLRAERRPVPSPPSLDSLQKSLAGLNLLEPPNA